MKYAETEALVVRAVPCSESDAVVTLLTRTEGKVSVWVRKGRQGTSRRPPRILEPLHTVQVTLHDKGGELIVLKEVQIVKARIGILQRLDTMEAAGQILRWARHLWPVRTPEPAAWHTVVDALDRLEAGTELQPLLACTLLRLLTDVGYQLELSACVHCRKVCPAGRSAGLDLRQGGIVCAHCGGGVRRLDTALRAAALAIQQGEHPPLSPLQANTLLLLSQDALSFHTAYRVESTRIA